MHHTQTTKYLVVAARCSAANLKVRGKHNMENVLAALMAGKVFGLGFDAMLKALADRMAEAFAELLHKRVRRELWGYAKDEALSNDDMIAEKYRGIRPAPGYPACPDHTEKASLFGLLSAPAVGIDLTDSFAMLPASSVSGFYLAHPQAQYFAVGPIGEDQRRDIEARMRETRAEQDATLAVAAGLAGCGKPERVGSSPAAPAGSSRTLPAEAPAPEAPAAPVQLGAQQPEIVVAGRVQQAKAAG